MRLYNAICAWLEAHAKQLGGDDEPGRETQLDALVETSHSYTTQPEMHLANRGQSIDDDDGGVYKHRRIGFTRNQPRGEP